MGKILLKFLITAYAITTALLLLLALFVYKCYLPDKAVNACIIVIYILSTFLAGFLSGKRIGSRNIYGDFVSADCISLSLWSFPFVSKALLPI